MKKLMPILKHRDEFERQNDRDMFVDEFFGEGIGPFAMYGEDGGDFISYSPSKNAEEDAQTKATALENLAATDVPIQIMEPGGFKLAWCEHEYAAEKIMDPAFLKKLAAELGTKGVVVGIPMKCLLVAVATGQGEQNLFSAVTKQYQNTSTYPLSDQLYYIVDGEIEMTSAGKDEEGRMDTEEGVLKVAASHLASGKLAYQVWVGHPDLDKLGGLIQQGFQQIMLMAIKDSDNFSGKIDYHIMPEQNPRDANLEARLQRYAKNISERGAVQLMGALAKEEFKVRFYYGKDDLVAETIETDPVQMNRGSKKKKPWWKFW